MNLPVSREWLERKQAAHAPVAGERRRPIDALFAKQREVVEHPARFKAMRCGSRAGKTETICRAFADAMQRNPGMKYLYACPTRPQAKNILWEPLRLLNIQEGWGLDLHESELRARHPNGSWLLLAGLDSKPELEKGRGTPWKRVCIDECGSIKSSDLKYYVEQVIHPRLMDHKGDCWLSGTPAPVAAGYFYQITSGAIHGWKNFHWTAKDNPHVDYDDFVHHPETGWLALRQCTQDSPAFKREILGEWSVDTERLIMRFERERNLLSDLPALREGDVWSRLLALDFGVGHATAAVVLAYPKRWGRDAYAVHSWQATGLAPSDAAAMIKKTYDDYRPDSLIGDVNGLGKGYEREWNKHFRDIPMRPALKADKRAALEIVSDRFHVARQSDEWSERRGLFVLDGNDELCTQLSTVQWDEDRADIAPGQADDLFMAAVYAYRYCPAFANKDADPPPLPESTSPFDRFIQRKQLPRPPSSASDSFRGAFRRGR